MCLTVSSVIYNFVWYTFQNLCLVSYCRTWPNLKLTFTWVLFSPSCRLCHKLAWFSEKFNGLINILPKYFARMLIIFWISITLVLHSTESSYYCPPYFRIFFPSICPLPTYPIWYCVLQSSPVVPTRVNRIKQVILCCIYCSLTSFFWSCR